MVHLTVVGGCDHAVREDGKSRSRGHLTIAHQNKICARCGGIAHSNVAVNESGRVYVFCGLFCKVVYRRLHGKDHLPEWQ